MNEMQNIPWVVELRTPQMAESLKLPLQNRMVIGRNDKKQEIKPDVDLSAYNAEELGVSRQHLAIQAENDILTITDLKSGNGSLLNGARMEPGKPYPLRSGDVLHLGRLQLTVNILVSPSQGSIFHKQSNLQIDEQGKPSEGQLIMIVEDHPEVARVVSLILERAGFKTQIYSEVASAMRAFNRKPPSALILDIMLPDMNGLELCRYVRRNIQRNMVPIIVISAVTTPEKVGEAIDAGADIFLGKPVSAKELQHVVTSLVAQHESGKIMLGTKHLAGTAPLQAMEPESRQDSVVLFISGHSDSPIAINLKNPVSFGRAADLPPRSYVDLTRFNAIDHGVSRIHMTLHRKGGRFYIEDHNSINGTYLNGDPLKPQEWKVLSNADEIRLGQLRMYIYFLSDREAAVEDETKAP